MQDMSANKEPSSNNIRKRAALYMRVSTEHQIDKFSLPMQKKDLYAYANLILGIGDDDCVPFEDAGYSGKNTDRPAFQSMMNRVRKGEFTHVLVWKIDRISRNLLDFAQMYDDFKKHGVTFVSKNEQFDTSSAMGEAMLKIILVFAELEREMTSERVTATMISRAANGKWNGGRIPFGYDYDPGTKTFSINQQEANVVREIIDDLLRSRSLVHTCKMLNEKGYKTKNGNEWGLQSVYHIAKSPFYTGEYKYNEYQGTDRRKLNPESEWVCIQDHHPAIITQLEHEKIVAYLSENYRGGCKRGHNMTANVHIFSGILFCDECGRMLRSASGRTLRNGFRGTIYSCPGRTMKNPCSNRATSDSVVGEFALNFVLNMINLQKNFSPAMHLSEIGERLTSGSCFRDVSSIDSPGVTDYYYLLCSVSGTTKMKPPSMEKKKEYENPEISHLRKEKEKYEKALTRLQNLYLYSDQAMSERDYILNRQSIIGSLDEINGKLGMLNTTAEEVSDPEFVDNISRLIVMKVLTEKPYVNFTSFAASVDPEIIREYFLKIIDSIKVFNSHITSITFKNGLCFKFKYAETRDG